MRRRHWSRADLGGAAAAMEEGRQTRRIGCRPEVGMEGGLEEGAEARRRATASADGRRGGGDRDGGRRRATASADGRRGEVTGDALWKVEGGSDVQDSRRVIQAARSVADGGGAAGWCGGGARGEVRRWTAVGRLSVGFFLFEGTAEWQDCGG
jgi:hypothetical protein